VTQYDKIREFITVEKIIRTVIHTVNTDSAQKQSGKPLPTRNETPR
jgi:hypothetical protein